ncbi:MAG: SapC family protein [Alphaproteobacteria bacterium]|nr:SapC family protein [Alphaproteobacteria bacterium]
MTEQKEQVLPLFYKNPQAITVEQHENLSLTVRHNYMFAKNANSIPLVTSEYAIAAKHYPIVFIKDEVKTSLVITGFREGENVFVNNSGEWAKDQYIPGYVNRYPFIFLEDEANDQLVLCMDVDAEIVNTAGGNPLFKDSKPTEFAENALKTCTEYQGFLNATRAFVEALIEQDLLVENQAELTAPDGKILRLTGFCVIDETKFKELSDETILDWHKKGWLYLTYAHFISMSNWARIAQLTQSDAPTSTETVH